MIRSSSVVCICVCSELWKYVDSLNGDLQGMADFVTANPASAKQLLKRPPAKRCCAMLALHGLSFSCSFFIWTLEMLCFMDVLKKKKHTHKKPNTIHGQG